MFPHKENWTAYSTIALSALLGFLIQPLMGKQLIPFYGGSTASWIGAMLFFQTALLLGYSWAFWLLKKTPKLQLLATLSLSLCAVLTFHLPTSQPTGNPNILEVICKLSLACLPITTVLFSSSLLITGWLSNIKQKVPYHIYAISNIGSLSGLLLYAFVIEPSSPLPEQTSLWKGLAMLTLTLLCWRAYKNYKFAPQANPQITHKEKISKKDLLLWIGLSALPCTLMISATYLIGGEIGSNPLAWTGPFGLYLLAFAIAFTGIIKKEHLPWVVLPTLIFTTLYLTISQQMEFKTFGNPAIRGELLIALLNSTFFACLLPLTLLHESKPAHNFSTFYITSAIGGSLGGLLSTFVIPYIFTLPIEFPLLLIASVATGLAFLTKTWWQGPTFALITLSIPFIIQTNAKPPESEVAHIRDIHGHLSLQKYPKKLHISSHSTLHGTQLLDAPRTATTYYTPSSPIGRIFENKANQPLRVGIIGLGAGTIATYAKPNDKFTFWDIDPKAIGIANSEFSYLSSSLSPIQVIEQDGRIGLQNSEEDFDLIIIDAYTGDAVPPQLLTKQAFEIYKRRLKNKTGMILIHHSTRYSQYDQVITNTAHSAKLNTLHIHSSPEPEERPDGSVTNYSLVGPHTTEELLDALKSPKKLKREITQLPPQPYPIWTDEFNSILHVLNPSKLLIK